MATGGYEMAYKVPFVDFPAQYRGLRKEILGAVEEVFNRGDFILRSQVTQLEEAIASSLGVDYGIGLNSGTDALYLSLKAAGIGPGDEVITVSHTYVATVAVIVHCGATPILVDVTDDFNMDVAQFEPAISPRTRAVIPVHLNGRVCDMERIMEIASRHNLAVIEDAAQSLGATFDGKKGGSFGLTGCFSFYPAKLLGAAGDAGMVVTNDKELDKKIRLLRDHGRETKDDFACFGFNSRLDNLQAAILNVKLKVLPRWIDRRRQIAGMYQQGLGVISYVKLPPPPQPGSRYFDVYQNYVIQAQQRDALCDYLLKCGIEILVSNPIPVHHQKALGLSHFHLPVTEQLALEVLSLPMNTEISNEQVELVIDSVRQFYKR